MIDDAYTDGEPDADRGGTSQLDDSLRDLQNLVGGLAARLLGPKAASKLEIDPEKPVISPEVDRALEGLGDSVGHLLSQAGEELRAVAGVRAEARDGPAAEDPELEGWSPLVIGARAFAESLGSVAAELVERVNQKAAGSRGEE